MKKCIVKLINGISKKNGKEYYRIDIIFDLGNAREYKKSVFLDYKDVLLLDVKPEDCDHV